MDRKSIRYFLLIFGILFCHTLQALDLKQFQGFMQPELTRVKPPKTVPPKKFKDVVPKNEQAAFLYVDADASYKNSKLTTLPSAKKVLSDAFTLPAGTRIPESLQPLMTDRKNPRQGISLSGLSGGMLTPSPGVLEPGKTAVSVHAMPFDLYSVNDTKYTGESYFDSSIKLTYGAFEGFEFGVDKIVGNQDRYSVEQPTYINAKYQVPGNITIGGNFCPQSSAGYSSAWIVAGVPVLWVGAGINAGPESYKFTYLGRDTLKRSKFGKYNYDYAKGEGYADPAFFMVGGGIPVNNATHFVYDFNGDKFSLGLRFDYQKVAYFDAHYVSDGDYERLPGAIAHKRVGNFVFGGSIIF